MACDLADNINASEAGARLATQHNDLDELIHNGAMWLPRLMNDVSEMDIQACNAPAAFGSLALTRRLFPILRARDNADIHIVVSTSGLLNRPLKGASVPSAAAKSAQSDFVHGLTPGPNGSNVRLTAAFEGDFADISPIDPAWHALAPDHTLCSREVVNAAHYSLNQPAKVAIRSLVIQ